MSKRIFLTRVGPATGDGGLPTDPDQPNPMSPDDDPLAKRQRKDGGIGPGRKDKGAGKLPTKTYRFDIELKTPNSKETNEVFYSDYVEEAEANDPNKKGSSWFGGAEDPNDPFHDPNEDREVARLAAKFEAKYGGGGGGKSKRKKRRAWEDLIDKGQGYDETDPFIDNEEAYDELLPSTLTTKLGGFYINMGELEFKEVSDSDEEVSKPVAKRKSPVKEVRKEPQEPEVPAKPKSRPPPNVAIAQLLGKDKKGRVKMTGMANAKRKKLINTNGQTNNGHGDRPSTSSKNHNSTHNNHHPSPPTRPPQPAPQTKAESSSHNHQPQSSNHISNKVKREPSIQAGATSAHSSSMSSTNQPLAKPHPFSVSSLVSSSTSSDRLSATNLINSVAGNFDRTQQPQPAHSSSNIDKPSASTPKLNSSNGPLAAHGSHRDQPNPVAQRSSAGSSQQRPPSRHGSPSLPQNLSTHANNSQPNARTSSSSNNQRRTSSHQSPHISNGSSGGHHQNSSNHLSSIRRPNDESLALANKIMMETFKNNPLPNHLSILTQPTSSRHPNAGRSTSSPSAQASALPFSVSSLVSTTTSINSGLPNSVRPSSISAGDTPTTTTVRPSSTSSGSNNHQKGSSSGHGSLSVRDNGTTRNGPTSSSKQRPSSQATPPTGSPMDVLRGLNHLAPVSTASGGLPQMAHQPQTSNQLQDMIMHFLMQQSTDPAAPRNHLGIPTPTNHELFKRYPNS